MKRGGGIQTSEETHDWTSSRLSIHEGKERKGEGGTWLHRCLILSSLAQHVNIREMSRGQEGDNKSKASGEAISTRRTVSLCARDPSLGT